MAKENINTIKDFLEWRGSNGEKPEEYDFKRNMYEYYQSYNHNVRRKLGDKAYEEFMNGMPYGTEESSIKEWLAYKTADAKWPGKRFDCDNSNATCTLTRLVYVLLWNWGTTDEDKVSQPLMTFGNKKFGGDTMNSFATTFNEYMQAKAHGVMSTEKMAKMFSMTGEKFWQEEIGKEFWERWNKFARNTQCIGNFVLVPYYFNKDRYGKTKDYWDMSLDLLKNNDGKFDKKNKDWETDKKSLEETSTENMPIDWNKGDYNRYINLFFLWDYVKCEDLDENGSPKPRWLFDRKRNILPQEQIDFQNFLDNVNKRIERRGRFMVAMLRIASGINYDGKSRYEYCGNYEDKWEGWKVSGIYKIFVDKVFWQNEVYDGYKGVIRQMEVVIDNTENLKGTSEAQWLHGILGELSVLT